MCYVRKTEVRKVVRREVSTQNRITQRITHGIEIIDLVASRLREQHFQKTNIQMIEKALDFATTNGVQFPTVIQSINKSLPINLEQKSDPVHDNISKDTNSKTLPVLERAKFNQWANKLTEAELIGMATSALRSAPDSLQFDNVGREAKWQR